MINFGNSLTVGFLAGIGLFMFGMHLAGHSLEKLMADRITKLMHRLSESQFVAIVVGITLTTLLQSSGTVTSMLVGLGSARVISLSQVMGVILGTALGSTVMIQIISFDLAPWAWGAFSISFVISFLAKKNELRSMANVGIGFSFLFIGLAMITQSSQAFAADTEFRTLLHTLHEHPFMILIVSTLLCATVHSSAVTIGIAMALAQAHSITIGDAILWVYGANIGTTSVALVASLSSNNVGKQVAWAHFLYKTLGTGLFFLPFVHENFVTWLTGFQAPPARVIANAHLFLNLTTAILFYPFIQKGARWIESFFPKAKEEDFRSEYMNLANYQSSALAISYANREILRTADLVLSMVEDSLKLFESSDPFLIQKIKDRDNQVDFLYRETKMFLLDHANKSNTAVHQDIMSMIMFLSDLERAADAIDINILTLAIKKSALKLEFSTDGWNEIQQMHAELLKVTQTAIAAFTNRELCEEAIRMKREMSKTEHSLRESHIGRLNRGLRESINTSSIHLDLLSEYRRIAGLLCTHAYNQNTDRTL